MLQNIKKRLFWMKSRTVQVMGVYLPGLGLGLEALRAEAPALQDYVPDGLYTGIIVAGAVALVLRLVTTKPLSAYREPGYDIPQRPRKRYTPQPRDFNDAGGA